MGLLDSEKEKIVRILKEKKTKFVCPMCGNKNFILAEGYLNQIIQENLKNITLEGRSIPTIPIVCSQCGFVSQHALGILGILKPGDDNVSK